MQQFEPELLPLCT